MSQNLKNKGIVLFDGYCNLCAGSVKFILKRDSKDYFRFSSLQTEESKKILFHYNYSIKETNSVILVENFKAYDKSTAALRIAKKLDKLWPIMYAFILIPKPVRDFIYMIFSKNRFKWFGRRTECFLPEKKYEHYFL